MFSHLDNLPIVERFGDMLPTENRKSRRRALHQRLGMAFVADIAGTSPVGGQVTYTPDATAVEVFLHNFKWAKDQGNKLVETTNAQSGSQEKWLGTINYQTGSFEVLLNVAAMPSTVGIVEGLGGTLKEYHGSSGKYKSQAIKIEKIGHGVEIQSPKALSFTITYKGNGPVTDN